MTAVVEYFRKWGVANVTEERARGEDREESCTNFMPMSMNMSATIYKVINLWPVVSIVIRLVFLSIRCTLPRKVWTHLFFYFWDPLNCTFSETLYYEWTQMELWKKKKKNPPFAEKADLHIRHSLHKKSPEMVFTSQNCWKTRWQCLLQSSN